MIRIAFCLDSLDVGGTELNAVRTLENLDRSRFEPLLLHFRAGGPLLARFRSAGIPTIHIKVRSLLHPSVLGTVRSLVRALRSHRVDILHAQDVYSDILGIPSGRFAGVPLLLASRRWQAETPRRIHRIASRWGFRLADRVIVNSASVAAAVTSQDGVPARRVVVIPNFVDDAAFDDLVPGEIAAGRGRLGLPAPPAVVVGVVARLVPVKNHAVLLRALARLPRDAGPVHLAFAGDGPLLPALEAEAESLGIRDRVTFLGHQPPGSGLNQLFDIAALCSRHEGFPNALVEAMAAGRPIIATRVPGNVDAVEDGVNGLLVPDDDPIGLAAALQSLASDAGRRRTMGGKGRELARVRYDRRTVLGTLAELYASRLEARRDRKGSS